MNMNGMSSCWKNVMFYRQTIIHMSDEEREEIFFLKANDLFFDPYCENEGKKINVELEARHEFKTFTDIPLIEKKGYFVVAAPST
jgi:hypothetical protein